MLISDIKKKDTWYLLTLKDPNYLPGKNIFKIIELLLKVVDFKFAITNALEGTGNENYDSLKEKENSIIEINDLLQLICDINQFVWGDFFLFTKYPKSWNNPAGKDYPYVIRQADMTIRAIDNLYIDIYTQNKNIVDLISNNFEVERIKNDSLDNLDYPE